MSKATLSQQLEELEIQYFRLSKDEDEEKKDSLRTSWISRYKIQAKFASPCSKEEYDKYMRSKKWKDISGRVKQRADGKCEICGNDSDRLCVHHEVYPEKPGLEKDEDLIAMCGSCHRKAHTRQVWIYT